MDKGLETLELTTKEVGDSRTVIGDNSGLVSKFDGKASAGSALNRFVTKLSFKNILFSDIDRLVLDHIAVEIDVDEDKTFAGTF